MTKGFVAPQQQRSRETLARLIAATLVVLEEHGLEGATIPRIASAAGIAPASVYRRFRDRNALYRMALLDALERSTQNSLALGPLGEQTLESTARQVVDVTLRQYRLRPGLMRALTRFLELDSDNEFRTRALRCVSANFDRLADTLLAYSDEIRHSEPRAAIIFALLTMATVIEVRALENVSMWHELTRLNDKEFTAEVTKTFLGYLRS